MRSGADPSYTEPGSPDLPLFTNLPTTPNRPLTSPVLCPPVPLSIAVSLPALSSVATVPVLLVPASLPVLPAPGAFPGALLVTTALRLSAAVAPTAALLTLARAAVFTSEK